MSSDPRLPQLDPSAEVIDFLTSLLRAARHHPDFAKWLELKSEFGDDLDRIREAAADTDREIRTAALAGPNAAKAIEEIASRFDKTPALVLIAAVARGLDDLYGDYLHGPWLADRLKKVTIQADDLIVVPGSEHLRALFGDDRSLSAPQTRAMERPDQTRRCRLYEPPAASPPIRLANDLAPHLDEVMSDAKLLATAHPTTRTADLEISFPVRAKDERGHVQACVELLERAFEEHVSVIVFPEFSGYPVVTDELRQLSPTSPAPGGGRIRPRRDRLTSAESIARLDCSPVGEHPGWVAAGGSQDDSLRRQSRCRVTH